MVNAVANNSAEQEILDYISTRLRFTHAEVATYCGASEWTRQNYLRALQRQGVVRECGKDGYATCYTVFDPEEARRFEANGDQHERDTERSKARLASLIASMNENGARNLELPSAEPRSPEEKQIWKYINDLAYFTAKDLKTVCASETIRTRFFQRLKQAQAVRVFGRGNGETFYTTKLPSEVRDSSKSKRDSLEGIMWTAIRRQKRFRPIDLYASLVPARPDVSKKGILAYCRTLRLAGYLRAAANNRGLGEDTPLRLIKDSGPLPPVKRSMTVVVDSNDEKIVYAPGGRL
ncbi:hypothetical protein [Phaeobacter inhibens]|uniref:hypothetical protein n=1 Tax=Phaeobacter inhibens TaxID=221822 RepID=UPI0021A6C720|nr:hypothetical protein [Phaeobacter inhibens]UWR43639.1 hypothetical protein K4F86_09665 [Phaeobacter inhibens]